MGWNPSHLSGSAVWSAKAGWSSFGSPRSSLSLGGGFFLLVLTGFSVEDKQTQDGFMTLDGTFCSHSLGTTLVGKWALYPHHCEAS